MRRIGQSAIFLVAFLVVLLVPGAAVACTVSNTSINLGSQSSFAVGTTPVTGSGSGGLRCNVTLAALTTHYIGLQIQSSTFRLVGPEGNFIPFTASLQAANGTPVVVGGILNLSSVNLLSLFSSADNSVPVYLRAAATPGLRAGKYTGSITVRWHYSVCSVGAVVCLDYATSPGFVRPFVGPPTNWGSGVAATINIELTVQNDCIIIAPSATFGTAPLVSSFDPITRTILIRCSAGTEYSVGLDNGSHADNGVRRMRSGTNYLRYDIYKSASSPDRWGSIGNARRSSSTAESNAGSYDSVIAQSFTYRAAMLPAQTTPPPGVYADTIRIDVAF